MGCVGSWGERWGRQGKARGVVACLGAARCFFGGGAFGFARARFVVGSAVFGCAARAAFGFAALGAAFCFFPPPLTRLALPAGTCWSGGGMSLVPLDGGGGADGDEESSAWEGCWAAMRAASISNSAAFSAVERLRLSVLEGCSCGLGSTGSCSPAGGDDSGEGLDSSSGGESEASLDSIDESTPPSSSSRAASSSTRWRTSLRSLITCFAESVSLSVFMVKRFFE